MKTEIGTMLIVLPVLFAQSSSAQDYRLPPSMQGKPAPVKPETDYRIPGTTSAPQSGRGDPEAVRINGFSCTVTTVRPGDSTGRGSAGGGLTNVSAETLTQIDIAIEWQTAEGRAVSHSTARAQTLPLAPRKNSLFNSVTAVPTTAKKCAARVSVAR